MPDSTHILSARSIHKTYRLGKVGVPVLRGVDLDLAPGEWLAILGASGSGKSTLLHLLGGLDRPDTPAGALRVCRKCGAPRRGLADPNSLCSDCGAPIEPIKAPEIIYEGRDLFSMSGGDLNHYRAHDVGFVFQFYHLLPELNIVENVTIGAMVRYGRFGYMRYARQARQRAEHLLGAFGLSHRLRHRPRELSGGERQRVAIARALINEPRILLADEPTGNLDRVTGHAILDAIEQLQREQGLTMVMVTHDPGIAERAARTVRLVDGRVAEHVIDRTPLAGEAR